MKGLGGLVSSALASPAHLWPTSESFFAPTPLAADGSSSRTIGSGEAAAATGAAGALAMTLQQHLVILGVGGAFGEAALEYGQVLLAGAMARRLMSNEWAEGRHHVIW